MIIHITYPVVQFLYSIILRIIFHQHLEALFVLLPSECVIMWKYCLQMCFTASGYHFSLHYFINCVLSVLKAAGGLL